MAHPLHETILQPGYQAHFSPLLLSPRAAFSPALSSRSPFSSHCSCQKRNVHHHGTQTAYQCCLYSHSRQPLLVLSCADIPRKTPRLATPLPHVPCLRDPLAQESRRYLGTSKGPQSISPMSEGCESREETQLRRGPKLLLPAPRRIWAWLVHKAEQRDV